MKSVDCHERVSEICKSFVDTPGGLLPALWAIQNAYGYLAPEWTQTIADDFNLSAAEVYGVISFYKALKTCQPAKHQIAICRAEACQSMGGRNLEKTAVKCLSIEFDSSDRQFDLESVYCLGLCAAAPAMMVDGRLYGRVTEQQLLSTLERLQQE